MTGWRERLRSANLEPRPSHRVRRLPICVCPDLLEEAGTPCAALYVSRRKFDLVCCGLQRRKVFFKIVDEGLQLYLALDLHCESLSSTNWAGNQAAHQPQINLSRSI